MTKKDPNGNSSSNSGRGSNAGGPSRTEKRAGTKSNGPNGR